MIQREPIILDLSVWNEGVNIDVLRRKAHAAILRCQYGVYEDKKFKEYRAVMEPVDFPWTPYLFWLANVPADEQIDLFMELNGRSNGYKWRFDGKFGAYMDMEEGTRPITMTQKTLLKKWEEFVWTFYEKTGLKVGVYTSIGWWNANMPKTSLPKDLPVLLWAAHWGVAVPLLPRDWDKHELHQHDSKGVGEQYGIKSRHVDLNNYRADLTTFNRVYNLNLRPLSQIKTEPAQLPSVVRVNTSVLNLRSAPVISDSTLLGTTTRGKVFYPDGVATDEYGRDWYYIGGKKKLYLAAWLTVPA